MPKTVRIFVPSPEWPQEEPRPQAISQELPERPYRVLLPVINRQEAAALLPLAWALTEAHSGELFVLQGELIPQTGGPQEAGEEAAETSALEELLSAQADRFVWIQEEAGSPTEFWNQVWRLVDEEEIDLMVVGWSSSALPETALGDLEHPWLASPPCDLVIVRPGRDLVQRGWEAVQRVLVPVRDSPHAMLAIRVADALAEMVHASLTFLHVIEPAPVESPRDGDLLAGFATLVRNLARLNRSITTVGDVTQTILEEGKEHQALILGAPTSQEEAITSPLLQAIAEQFPGTVIVVKRQRRRRARDGTTPLPVQHERPAVLVVNKWFTENTFHSRDFENLEELVRLKEEQGLTISLGLPALNEEETVGHVIQTVKTALMEQFPLLDEMVLIDSGSVDYTREIAADLGIPVYIHQEVLPQYGAYHGKGEALWKSLHVLKGDLIAWIDTDIVNIHPRFVYGVLGPLLREPRLQYVKGFYRRPLRSNGKLVAGGGGRVTELTARPLLNLFFPELSGLVQPLSGEYAGRRSALEQLPFFTGYGVETGLLIDFLGKFGLQSIAQVDLKERVHHNQSLRALSQMSFAIIQVVIARLEQRFNVRLLEEVNKTMNLIRYRPDRFYLEPVEIRERERPPMVSLPEYRARRQELAAARQTPPSEAPEAPAQEGTESA